MSDQTDAAADAADHWFVAVGASGGQGLSELRALLSALGALPSATVMIVLHRPFDQPSGLREILARATTMPVVVAEDDSKLEPGRCYIGEPAAHLQLVARSFGELEADPGMLHRNRTVDFLFTSIANHAGMLGIGVVLSGSLDDGSRGLAAIHDAGGATMVVLPTTGPPGMPENAIGYDGPIDCIGTVDQIALAIRTAVGAGAAPGRTVAKTPPAVAG